MKKIMFNDKYGLTRAVLEGRKTQTRRLILSKTIEKAEQYRVDYFNDTLDNIPLEDILIDANQLMGVPSLSSYQVGEEVSIAQSYNDVYEELKRTHGSSSPVTRDFFHKYIQGGRMPVSNKMFVRAQDMPHHIKITNIRVERLQDISDDDCFKEGVYHDSADGAGLNWISCEDMNAQNELLRHEWHGKKGLWFWDTPQGAFAALIDKLSGKGTWDSNPLVFVYDFVRRD